MNLSSLPSCITLCQCLLTTVDMAAYSLDISKPTKCYKGAYKPLCSNVLLVCNFVQLVEFEQTKEDRNVSWEKAF